MHWTAVIHVFSCQSFVLDNETVVKDANLVILAADVLASTGYARDGAVQEYILDAWTDDATLLAWYQEDGFPMRGLAEIGFEQDATQTRLDVMADDIGSWSYSAPTGYADHRATIDGAYRFFFVADDGLAWMDLDLIGEQDYQIQQEGLLNYAGPPWRQYTGEDSGSAVVSYEHDLDERIETRFGP